MATPLSVEQQQLLKSAKEKLLKRRQQHDAYIKKMQEIGRQSTVRAQQIKMDNNGESKLRSKPIVIEKTQHGWGRSKYNAKHQDYNIYYNVLQQQHTQDILNFFKHWVSKGWFVEKAITINGTSKGKVLPTKMMIRIINTERVSL